ncbi:MAG: carboxypeptidase regulatory-like domain-containing protein [Acidobacteria bacterium]|nr:carboxypeptidase regulatory-like domain-containing protein [Acidobacteriota bacterium]
MTSMPRAFLSSVARKVRVSPSLRSGFRLVVLLPILIFGFTRITYGQTAQVTGRITDIQGAVVSGTALILTHTSTGTSRKTVSNQEGVYTIPFLIPGQYQLTVQKTGFKPIMQEGIVLSVERVARLDLVLSPGEVVEELTVESNSQLLNRETSSVGQVIDNRTIVTLPLNVRDFTQLALLSPATARCNASRSCSPVENRLTKSAAWS